MDKINKLTFIKEVENKGRYKFALFQCECGNTIELRKSSVYTNNTCSCGCMQKLRNNNLIHGLSYTKEYNAWRNMKQRCYNSKNKKYEHYGARGIIVCDRWLNSFENFLNDIGKAPDSSYSIERIEVNGNYEKDNCKWGTAKEQRMNQRRQFKN